MALSRLVKENRLALFQRLSPPGDQWCDVLSYVPSGSVSSFSTLQSFPEASHRSNEGRSNKGRSNEARSNEGLSNEARLNEGRSNEGRQMVVQWGRAVCELC